MPDRKPFVFGVGFILDESRLESLLHRQFGSDEELQKYMNSQGYRVDLKHPRVVYDANTGAVIETVGVNKGGGVGSLDLIDEEDKIKLKKLIDEAANMQLKRVN